MRAPGWWAVSVDGRNYTKFARRKSDAVFAALRTDQFRRTETGYPDDPRAPTTITVERAPVPKAPNVRINPRGWIRG